MLCWAEMAELPYLRVKMRMSRHDIVVIGYDDDTSTVVVVDNDRAEPQTIGQDDLARARSARGFPVPTRHTCFLLRFPDRLPDLCSAAAGSCADAAGGMTAAPPALPGLGVPAVSAVGLSGIAEFVDDLARWDEAFDGAELERALLTLWVFVEQAGTGGALFRRLQAGFLSELAEQVPEPAVVAARNVYQRLADRWSGLAATASADTSAAARLTAVRRQARALPDLEAEGVDRLRQVAAAL